jgi:predicted nucleic acid-binding protein
MALYKRLHAELLLVDDHRARRVAGLNGIAVVGSLGILIRAKESGFLPKIQPLLATIQAAGLYYSELLISEALRLAGEP